MSKIDRKASIDRKMTRQTSKGQSEPREAGFAGVKRGGANQGLMQAAKAAAELANLGGAPWNQFGMSNLPQPVLSTMGRPDPRNSQTKLENLFGQGLRSSSDPKFGTANTLQVPYNMQQLYTMPQRFTSASQARQQRVSRATMMPPIGLNSSPQSPFLGRLGKFTLAANPSATGTPARLDATPTQSILRSQPWFQQVMNYQPTAMGIGSQQVANGSARSMLLQPALNKRPSISRQCKAEVPTSLNQPQMKKAPSKKNVVIIPEPIVVSGMLDQLQKDVDCSQTESEAEEPPKVFTPPMTRNRSRMSIQGELPKTSVKKQQNTNMSKRRRLGRKQEQLDKYIEEGEIQIREWQEELKCYPKGEKQKERDKLRNKISAQRSRMNKKLEAKKTTTAIDVFQERSEALASMLEEELQETKGASNSREKKFYDKIKARIDQAFSSIFQDSNEKQTGSLEKSVTKFLTFEMNKKGL